MYNIAIIGAGQLGSRHLQGLALIDIPVCIDVFDVSEESLKTAQVRFKQMPDNDKITSINFTSNFEEVKDKLDLVIIATNADIRYSLIKNIVGKKQVKNFVLEKVVFQCNQHFVEILELIKEKGINCWVNCPRRMFPFYIELKNEIKKTSSITLTVQGGDWGLACNSIHYLDLLAFLKDLTQLEISANFLNRELYPSKRKGFVEISGLLIGKSGLNSITLFSNNQPSSTILTIKSDHFIAIVDEAKGQIIMSKEENNWNWEIEHRQIVYFQSELTHLFSKDILMNKSCSLTPLVESFEIHKPFLNEILRFINSLKGTNLELCPIT